MNVRLSFARIFKTLVVALAIFALVVPQVGVAAQANTNTPHWDDPTWVDQFVAGAVNAVFSSANPLPVPEDLPEAIQDALDHDISMSLIEPWHTGCPVNPETDPNCNVGYVKSFYDYTKLYNAVYGDVEANEGHVGPWTDGSVHMTRLPEVAAGVANESDWSMFVNGDLRITFAENQKLPASDPSNGANSFRLIEPWRHTCMSETTDPNCNVGESGVFPDWQSMKNYLLEGNWTRGSVMVQDKVETDEGTLPEASNEEAPPAEEVSAPADNGDVIVISSPEEAKASCEAGGLFLTAYHGPDDFSCGTRADEMDDEPFGLTVHEAVDECGGVDGVYDDPENEGFYICAEDAAGKSGADQALNLIIPGGLILFGGIGLALLVGWLRKRSVKKPAPEEPAEK